MNEVQTEQIAAFLISNEARAVAAELEFEKDSRRVLLQLRRSFNPWQAAALVDQSRARRSMQGRHALAHELHLDTLAASQASSEDCARRRAGRFPSGALVADIGCSVGIDCLALAARGPVIALDRDLGRLLFARANLKLRDQTAFFVQGSAPEAVPRADYLHADPDRRRDGKRRFDPEEASPRLSELLALKPRRGLAVKLSPMADLEPLSLLGELEFVGVGSELKEIVLYTGELAEGERRAVLADKNRTYVGELRPAPVASGLGDYVVDCHAALLRSGLMGSLAMEEGLALVSPQIAYLTGPEPAQSPFLKSFRVLEVSAPDPKRIRKAMKTQGIERVDLSCRGFPGDLKDFEKVLSRGKGEAGRVFLTRLGGKQVAILASPTRD